MSDYGTNIVDAITSSSRHEAAGQHNAQRMFSIVLFVVFVVVLLLALVAGASSYGSLVNLQDQNDARIMSTGPIVSSIRANDAAGGVSVGEGPEGRSLVLTQTFGEYSYETRIYLYQGSVVQEYTLAGAEYAPQKATRLADSSRFEFAYEGGLLTLTTDAGTTKVALRSDQGGE